MKRRTLLFLLIIIFFGTFLRLYRLDCFPPSLFGDEVDVGYQAYSILKTGRDYLGQPWPISFHSLADWRTPLFLYSAVPTVAIFGLNEWGVRAPAAIFGILTIPLLFLLVKKLFGKDCLGLLASLLLAFSLWHLQYSRAAFEVTQMLFLLVAGVYFFLKGLEKWPFMFLAAVLLALSPYSYNTAKFFLPLFLLLLLFTFWSKIKKVSFKRWVLVGLVFTLICLPLAKDIFFGEGGNRFSILSIFTDPVTVPEIGFNRQVDMNFSGTEVVVGMSPSLSSRIFHNKFLVWGQVFLKNYFKAFSTEFLFTFGDINYRHSIQGGFGECYWIEAISILAGIFFIFLNKQKNIRNFILGWLLLAPIPSALTRDGGNHATRLILMLPSLLILSSFGISSLWERIKNRHLKIIFPIVLSSLFIIQFVLYFHRYYVHYPQESEDWWHVGFKETAQYVKKSEKKYNTIVFSDSGEPPLIFSLFWLKVDPTILQKSKLEWTKINDFIMADHLPGTQYYFGHIAKEKMKSGGLEGALSPEMLYVFPEGETGLDYRFHAVPSNSNLLQTVYFPSGRVAKYVLTGLK